MIHQGEEMIHRREKIDTDYKDRSDHAPSHPKYSFNHRSSETSEYRGQCPLPVEERTDWKE